MGCDGGVLAMQRKYMRNLGHKLTEKNEEMSKRLRALIRSRCCAVSNEQLRDPIVACELGHLYNKEAVLLALLERTLNPAFQHIRGMKDLIPCRFTPNPNYKEDTTTTTTTSEASSSSSSSEAKGEAAPAIAGVDEDLVPPFICPVTRVEMNAKQPFVVLRSTGWVLSDRALREVGVANLQEEYGPFTGEDVIRLVPEEEEERELRTRMHERRARAKKEKKEAKEASKRKREEDGDKEGEEEEDAEGKEERRKEKREKKREKAEAAAAAAAASAANGNGHGKHGISSAPMGLKVASLAEEAKKAAGAEMAKSSAFASLFSSGGDGKATDTKRLLSVKR